MAVEFAVLAKELGRYHLSALGVVQIKDAPAKRWVVPVANLDRRFWATFDAAGCTGPAPLDRWVKSCLSAVTKRHGGDVWTPMQGPPFWPFQSWALALGDCWPSPLGILLHRQAGLWWAFRGALAFDSALIGAPDRNDAAPSPCADCAEQPCLQSCPVAAFDRDGFAANRCQRHLQTDHQDICVDAGCLARAACPYAGAARYPLAQRRFHMRHFRDSINRAPTI